MAVAAFWIALAAVLVAGHWKKKSTEQMRHDTVRLLIQQGKDVDQQQIVDLINPPPPALCEGHPWLRRPDPWTNYKCLRGLGVVLMIGAVGLGAMIATIGFGKEEPQAAWIGLGVGTFVFLLGVAFFYVSRYAKPAQD